MVKKINYICVELLKAIHNKDYSVVKTFGLPLVQKSGGFFMPKCFTNTLK